MKNTKEIENSQQAEIIELLREIKDELTEIKDEIRNFQLW